MAEVFTVVQLRTPLRLLTLRARLLARHGDHVEAERHAREGIALAATTDYLELNADAYLALAEVLRASGSHGEIEALRTARIDFEIVPGITAAIGAAAGAKISLTDRRVASQVLFTTFSRGESGQFLGGGLNWAAITPETTIAIYMPGTYYGEVAERLMENGLSPETPCVIVSHATRTEQIVRWSNLAALSHEAQLPAPSILLVGRVATQWVDESGAKLNPEMRNVDAHRELRLDSSKQN